MVQFFITTFHLLLTWNASEGNPDTADLADVAVVMSWLEIGCSVPNRHVVTANKNKYSTLNASKGNEMKVKEN